MLTSHLTTSHWPASTEYPLLDETIGDLLSRVRREHPERIALIDGAPGVDRSWSYTALHDAARRCAEELINEFGWGARVAIWAANSPEWLILQFGAALAGVTVVTVNPAYQFAELEYVLRDSGAVALFHGISHRGNDLAAAADRAVGQVDSLRSAAALPDWVAAAVGRDRAATGELPDVGTNDVAMVQYTSGTTGAPKGVLISHGAMVNSANLVARRAGLADGCMFVNPMPTFHIGSCGTVTLGTITSAGTQVIAPGFEPDLILDLIDRHRATAVLAVPTMLIAMLEHPRLAEMDASSLDIVLTGGSTATADLVRRVKATFGAAFSITFGQTETGGPSTQTDLGGDITEQSETIGRALPHTEVKIVDPATGQTLPCDVQGEICSRGPTTMVSYLDRPDDHSLRDDGWLHYGDLGTMDAAGYLRITGRSKDMIIRGGENISPREIEEVLCAYPGVLDAAVVGAPDPKWGEQVAAFVRVGSDPAPTSAELTDHCTEHLARHKVPKIWRFVSEFPLTPSGKIQKFRLREELR